MNTKLDFRLCLFVLLIILAGCSQEEIAEKKAENDASKALVSAQSGAPIGQLKIGSAYHMGNGVPQDNKYAYMWVSLAVEQGLGATAEETLAKITADMTPSEIEDAKKLAFVCKNEKGYRDC